MDLPRRLRVIQESKGGSGNVVSVELACLPSTIQAFGDSTGGIGPGEEVHDQIARIGQQIDEEFRKASGNLAG